MDKIELIFSKIWDTDKELQESIIKNYRSMSVEDKINENDEDEMLIASLCYYYKLFNFKFDKNISIKYCEKILKINKDNSHALFFLSHLTNDWTKKKELLELSMNLGNGNAYEYMGFEYKKKRDYNLAIYFYTKGTELNNKYAYKSLAMIYNYGHGIKEDKKKAIELYEKSIELGCAESIYSLAILYYNQNEKIKAYNLMKKSKDMGYAPSREWLDNKFNNNIDIFDLIFEHENKINQLEQELAEMKKQFQELHSLCFQPGNLICKNAEKHFYEAGNMLKNK